MLLLSESRPLGLYVHWPFCLSKCPYCDFNSHAAAGIDQGHWRAALLRELDWYGERTAGRPLSSIFFGGGTPSLMEPDTVRALIERAGQHWRLDDRAEITLEANPSTVEAARFAAFRAAGINRLSLGVQALNVPDLHCLGRRHDAAEALAALELAGRLFPRFSFDLIYARPGQSEAQWRAELTRALGLAGDHLSVYQLTIEEGTAFFPRHRRGEFLLPDEDSAAAMFALTRELTAGAGLPAYEISNHARPGQESRHNLIYWRGDDYAGIGPGAHGRVDGRATRQHRAPDVWLRRVESDGHATQEDEFLAPLVRAEEMVMMGLRLEEGIDAARFARLSGLDLWQVIDGQACAALEAEGFVQRRPAGLRATEAGLLLLNAVTARLLIPANL